MLNPITYTEDVVRDFLRYQLTTYGFADVGLHDQLRALLSLEETRNTPLMKGPFVSLSRAFRQGATIEKLVTDGILHPHFRKLAPYPVVRGHQETAFRAIHAGRPTLVSTGTGSGKTECFLYPVIDHALRLRDEGVAPGVTAVIIYPMNALAADQLKRLRELLAGSGITFGMYVGSTPERQADVTGQRLSVKASHAEWVTATAKAATGNETKVVLPPEERASREEMRASPPRILLTNVKQLELLLTRQTDIELFRNSQLRYIVFDEAHTFSGAMGAESAVLVRRLRAFCKKAADEVVSIATSATIADPERGVEAGREFAARFFGVDPKTVELVGEAYEKDDWATEMEVSDPLPGDPAVQLKTVFDAVKEVESDTPTDGEVRAFVMAVRSITGKNIRKDCWAEDLYRVLASNKVVFELAEMLASARPMDELIDELGKRIGRPVPLEEVLIWLTLGSVARSGGRPLLRPVVHVFVRGMAGAVVTFPANKAAPSLWLSAQDADNASAVGRRFPILTCTTCSQHYFTGSYEDFEFTGRVPGGGRAVDGGRYWQPLEAGENARRLVFLDHLAGTADEGDDDDGPAGTHGMYLCRVCGAMHDADVEACLACGRGGTMVTVNVVKQSEKRVGYLHKCVACTATGRVVRGSYREPARPVRAVGVSDIHVLAQNMLHRAERPRLLIFADNRQDAAFQAGWMQDHARRYRLRALFWEAIRNGAKSVGELVTALDDLLEGDDSLSQALLPEVWAVEKKTPTGGNHQRERKTFLRLQVAREVTTGLRQRIGLEPWGRLDVGYLKLTPELLWIQTNATTLGLSPVDLCDGIALLLDIARRSGALYDPETLVYTRRYDGGTRLVQRGYIPEMLGLPKGLKLQREDGDHKSLMQWWGSALTRARQVVQGWGLEGDACEAFITDLWAVITAELQLLVPVTAAWANGNAIPGMVGAHQVDIDRLVLTPRVGRFRCGSCRRVQLRAGPGARCIQWRCSGTVSFETENPDDYDLRVMDEGFRLIRPREHSAQVSADRRTEYENLFKNERVEVVNTLVATPTLELGVDIGALDSVLMRNVPPQAANYWQRAGRAGRRHRMSVNITYAHPRSHDRAYFDEPLKLLGGLITPPRFNLRNALMVRKHVHATVLTILYGAAREDSDVTPVVRSEISAALARCFPSHVSVWLFDEQRHVRLGSYDVSLLTSAIARERPAITAHLKQVFAEWPAEDRDIVDDASIGQMVDEMTSSLEVVVRRIEARLRWAMGQLTRLRTVADLKGTLDPEDQAMRSRAELLINRLKGQQTRQRRDAEGFDDTYTMAVLAAEGFLPGYGLDGGGVVGSFEAPRFSWLRDFELRRAPSIALREFVPGNLIYANGFTFGTRTYRFPPGDPITFEIDREHEAVREKVITAQMVAGVMSGAMLDAMSISDCEVPNISHITDEDESRFQLPVSVLGHAKARHAGGRSFSWGGADVQLRRQQHLRLVNVGASSETKQDRFGYPTCLVCGTARSPFASDAEIANFEKRHVERCLRKPSRIGFFADIVADAIFMEGCAGKTEAWSIGEALRQGAADVLDMERGDLVSLVLGNAGETAMTLVIYDPMPGGSGLLDQMLERWDEVVAAALKIVEECPACCEVSCIDCLRHYRNQWAHDHLDRHLAVLAFQTRGSALGAGNPIPPRMEQTSHTAAPVGNPAERLLVLFDRAGFPPAWVEHRIELALPLHHTDVDFFFPDKSGQTEGICVYVDGLSRTLHGNAETAAKDRRIRDELRNLGFHVEVIAASEVAEKDAVRDLFGRIARKLLGREKAVALRSSSEWMDDDE